MGFSADPPDAIDDDSYSFDTDGLMAVVSLAIGTMVAVLAVIAGLVGATRVRQFIPFINGGGGDDSGVSVEVH